MTRGHTVQPANSLIARWFGAALTLLLLVVASLPVSALVLPGQATIESTPSTTVAEPVQADIETALNPLFNPTGQTPAKSLVPMLKLVPITSPLTPDKALDHLYAYDKTPLGNRIPVIVLPGRIQEHQFTPWWKKLGRATEKYPDIQARFKFYLFLYDSKEQVNELTASFATELTEFQQQLPAKRSIRLISYSLGGMIARDALVAQPALMDRIDMVYGLTVPYHGSPMFNPDWFGRYLRHISPIRQGWDRITYRTYMSNKHNLLKGLYWMNFDQSQPSYLTRQQRKAQSQGKPWYPEQPVRGPLAENSPAVKQFKRRLVIYASYLPNQFTNPKRSKPAIPLLGPVIKAPKIIISAIVPFYGPSVHSVFKYMNKQMANLPTYSPDNPKGVNEHLYRYNDGIIPLSSMLYLPPRQTPYREGFEGLVKATDVCHVRVFQGTDHVDMGHYRWPTGILKTIDQVHPTEGEHSPIDWVLQDLGKITCL